MDEASRWRLTLAQRIAQAYAQDPNVDAVAVLGSVSRGCADRFSDIELGVFWSEPPSEREREVVVDRVGGTDWRPSPYNEQIEGWEEEYHLDGVKIDPGHFVTQTMERLIADVVDRHDVSLSKQNCVSAIQRAIPLNGGAVIERWQSKVASYPEEVARAMVRQYLSFSPFWMLEMLAERDDFLLVRHNFCAIERQLLLVLMGLNRIYYPGHKWIHHLIGELRVAPPDLSRRLKRVLRGDVTIAAKDLRGLIEETFALVDQHMPEVDTAEARTRAQQQPHIWEQPPIPMGRGDPPA